MVSKTLMGESHFFAKKARMHVQTQKCIWTCILPLFCEPVCVHTASGFPAYSFVPKLSKAKRSSSVLKMLRQIHM